jgi:hypothetical protein
VRGFSAPLLRDAGRAPSVGARIERELDGRAAELRRRHDEGEALHARRVEGDVDRLADDERPLPNALRLDRTSCFSTSNQARALRLHFVRPIQSASRQSQQVYEANRSSPRDELERAVLEILG